MLDCFVVGMWGDRIVSGLHLCPKWVAGFVVLVSFSYGDGRFGDSNIWDGSAIVCE